MFLFTSMLDEILKTRIMVKASMKKWKTDKVRGFNYFQRYVSRVYFMKCLPRASAFNLSKTRMVGASYIMQFDKVLLSFQHVPLLRQTNHAIDNFRAVYFVDFWEYRQDSIGDLKKIFGTVLTSNYCCPKSFNTIAIHFLFYFFPSLSGECWMLVNWA